MPKSNFKDFVLQSLFLATPEARVTVFLTGILILSSLDLTKTALPDICLWEYFVGYCPADGTTRGVNALLRGDVLKAIGYNKNVLLIIPVIAGILLKDLSKIYKRFLSFERR